MFVFLHKRVANVLISILRQIVALGQYAAIFVGLDNYALGKALRLMSKSDQLSAARVCVYLVTSLRLKRTQLTLCCASVCYRK